MKTTLNQSFTLLLWLNNARKNPKGELPIYLRITVDGVRVELAMSRFILEEQWDKKGQRAIGKGSFQISLNSYLDMQKAKVQSIYNQLLSSDIKITAKLIKEKLTGKVIQPLHKTILEAFDYHNIKLEEKVKAGIVVQKMVTRYKTTRDKVENFMKHQYKINDKPLPELRLAFVTEFEHYLLTKEKLHSNTAHKYIKNLKKIMNMAVGLDWIPSNPFNLFKCSYTNPEREILNHEELFAIIKKKIDNPRLAEVRDVFVFCCYTGFAYSDIYGFERNAVVLGLDGERWLSTNRQKTGTKESVPLLPLPLTIIDRYKNHEYCVKYNKLLPVNSNQRYNSYLKEIAGICGINKKLTSHIARHTFATTVTLSNGVPIETVSAMLGHNSIRTTQIYAKVVEKKVSEDMQLLRLKLSQTNSKKKASNE